jgi:hypothetical protein
MDAANSVIGGFKVADDFTPDGMQSLRVQGFVFFISHSFIPLTGCVDHRVSKIAPNHACQSF